MTKNFIPLIQEIDKKFIPLDQEIKKEKQIPYYRVIYLDGSYEDFDVETSSAAFKRVKSPAKVKLIKLCYRPLAD